jgi:hypothetical protein
MSEGLQQVATDVWSCPVHHTMMGLHLGTRMTIVRLPSGGLWLHSAIPITEALREAVDALGPLQHIVAPNVYHHSYAKGWSDAYPQARVYAPMQLRRKRRDLRIDADLSTTPEGDWGGALIPMPIDGCALHETVFVHPTSRTLISSDLIENFVQGTGHWYTDAYLKAGGIYDNPGWSRLLRMLYRDRAASRASLERLLAHDFDRLLLAHGRLIETGAKDAIRAGLHFLGPLG